MLTTSLKNVLNNELVSCHRLSVIYCYQCPPSQQSQLINNAKSSGQPKHFFSIRPSVVQGANHRSWGSAFFNLQQRQRVAMMNTQDKEFVRSPTESLIMPQCHFRSSQTFESCQASTTLSIFLAYVKLPGNLVLD